MFFLDKLKNPKKFCCFSERFCSFVDTSMLSGHSEKHTAKVSSFMLDIMCPLITEADAVSQEMLDVILTSVIEPNKVGVDPRLSGSLLR